MLPLALAMAATLVAFELLLYSLLAFAVVRAGNALRPVVQRRVEQGTGAGHGRARAAARARGPLSGRYAIGRSTMRAAATAMTSVAVASSATRTPVVRKLVVTPEKKRALAMMSAAST